MAADRHISIILVISGLLIDLGGEKIKFSRKQNKTKTTKKQKQNKKDLGTILFHACVPNSTIIVCVAAWLWLQTNIFL